MPPHERPWRHPSELPPPAHEPTTRTGRVLIVLTATLGLVLVGVMAVRMTPGRSNVPSDALVAATTTTSLLVGLTPDPLRDAVDDSVDGSARSFDGVAEAIGRTLSSMVSPLASTERADGDGSEAGAVALVTPVGTSGLGVTTEAAVEDAVGGHADVIEAMLPSGSIVTASVISIGDGVAVVELGELPERDGEAAAVELSVTTDPTGELTVVAHGDSIVVADGDFAALTVPEASPIFDADGDLIGLCSIGPDGVVRMLPITSLPDVTPPASVPESGTDSADSSTPDSSQPPASEPTPTELGGDETAVPSDPASSPAPPSSTDPPTSGPDTTTEQGTASTTSSSEPAPTTA